MQSQAIIHTANARRYLGQFCNHFAHKLPVVRDDANEAGSVPFPMGVCTLKADDAVLQLTVNGETNETIATLKDIVARHLIRFAFREEIELDWKLPA